MTKTESNITTTSPLLALLKGTFFAISTSLLMVLIFAFIIKFTSLNESLISPINQGIKIVSILIGTFVMSKKIDKQGWFWGILLGLAYSLLSFLIFSLLDGEFNFTLNILNDLFFAGLLGLISGIITFAVKK